MKEQHKCQECGKPFWVTMIKVFVFKYRYCPEDKTPLMISPDEQTYTCPKCNKVILKKDTIAFINLGINVFGSTRNFLKAEEEKAKGNVEVEKVMIAEEQLCQRCRNYQNRFLQANQKRERKLAMGVPDDIRVIPDEIKDRDIYRYEVMKKTQEDYRAKVTAEMKAQQEQQRKEQEAEQKAKIVKAVSEKLIDRSKMKPLIDPETQKLIDEAKKRDAEAKRKAEEDAKKNEQ